MVPKNQPSERGQLLREKSISDPAIDSSAAKEINPKETGRYRRRRWQQDDFLLFRPPLGASHHLLWSEEQLLPLLSENHAEYVKHELVRRAELARRRTELRLTGDFSGKSEYFEEFKGTQAEKAKPARRRPALLFTGGMILIPEYRERFVVFPRSRPRVVKRKDSLMPLEGEVAKESEVKAKFVAHPVVKRPEIHRKSTNLILEGEMECKAEYRESFVDFPRQRPSVEKPEGQLKTDGEFNCKAEYRSSFVDFPRERPSVNKPENAFHLNGESHYSAEYKESYVNFPRERPKVLKPEGDLKVGGEMSCSAEYKESFKDFPRERPIVKKPTGDLKPEGDLELQSEVKSRYVWLGAGERAPVTKRTESLMPKVSDAEARLVPEYRERYVTFPRERPRRRKPGDHLKPPEVTESTEGKEETEAKAKFTGEMGKRAEIIKRDDSLKMEGELEVNPEYREQFVAPPKEFLAAARTEESVPEVKVEDQSDDKSKVDTLKPPDAEISGRSTPTGGKSRSPTRTTPSPMGRRRRSVSAGEEKEEPLSPYRAFRVIQNPYIGYEPSIRVKAEALRRSPGSSPRRRCRPQKVSEAKRKASFVIINDTKKEEAAEARRSPVRYCATSSIPRGRWMPPWYAVPNIG